MIASPRSVRFARRVAGIDVGSNAMRLLAAEFSPSGDWRPLVSERAPVRLGAAVFGHDGLIRPATMDAAVEALTEFRGALDAAGVQHYRAAATSAVREARNGAVLLERVLSQADIRLEVITGEEEARLVWLAVADRLEPAGERWILADLGGGSVEIALADDTGILWSESHRIGTVRLLEELGGASGPPAEFRRRASEHVDTLDSRVAQDAAGAAGVAATGGNIEELARLADAPVTDNVGRLPVRDLSSLIDELAALSSEQRMKRFDLRPDRADVIVPAGLVYERIAHLTGADELVVPFVGLKEGLLLDAWGR